MGNIHKILKSWRVIIWIVLLIFMIVAINPSLDNRGVAIRSIDVGSAAELSGIPNPNPKKSTPRSLEVILEIENKPINSLQDYFEATSNLKIGQPLHIQTDVNSYSFLVKAETETIQLNETEIINITEEIYDEETNTTRNITRQEEINKTETIELGPANIGINIIPRPSTNIRKGLDLQGGTRVLLAPEDDLSVEDIDFVVDNLKQRLNIFGLSDVDVRAVNDLPKALGGTGEQFILVEIAGASKDEVESLIEQQGKFEAVIANQTVFRGGSEDISYVCRDATCSGIDPLAGCGQSEGGTSCRFIFSIAITPEAAKRFSDVTKDIPIDPESNGQYLTEQIHLVLDGVEQDALSISTSLRGRAETDIQISGSGAGPNQQLARVDTLEQMKHLQTLMKTGSLPTKLNVVSSQAVSASLGQDFVKNAIYMGLFAALAVAIVIFIRYRKLNVVIPILITSFSEVILLLGLASFIRWNIDISAIAGILIAVGTGVDHQIVITDEILNKEQSFGNSWKKRIKAALTIIMVAFLTTVVAMFPLYFAGAGLLRGFALITILGLSLGVFVSRPAYAAIADILLKE